MPPNKSHKKLYVVIVVVILVLLVIIIGSSETSNNSATGGNHSNAKTLQGSMRVVNITNNNSSVKIALTLTSPSTLTNMSAVSFTLSGGDFTQKVTYVLNYENSAWQPAISGNYTGAIIAENPNGGIAPYTASEINNGAYIDVNCDYGMSGSVVALLYLGYSGSISTKISTLNEGNSSTNNGGNNSTAGNGNTTSTNLLKGSMKTISENESNGQTNERVSLTLVNPSVLTNMSAVTFTLSGRNFSQTVTFILNYESSAWQPPFTSNYTEMAILAENPNGGVAPYLSSEIDNGSVIIISVPSSIGLNDTKFTLLYSGYSGSISTEISNTGGGNNTLQVTYPATFTESGLPPGTYWYLNITGNPSLSSTSTKIVTALPNGSYTYSIASSNNQYTPDPSSGTFSMAGSSMSEQVTFSQVSNNEVTISKSFKNAYVANEGDNTVSVIGIGNNTNWKTIPVGSKPYGIAVSSLNVYVTNSNSSTVSIIGIGNSTNWKTVTVGSNPIGIAVCSSNVYVADEGLGSYGGIVSETVSIIGLINNTVWKNVTVGYSPYALAISLSNVYVTNEGSGTVSIIGLINNTVWKNVTVGSMPEGIAVSSSNIYVTNSESGVLSIIGLANNTVWKTIPIGISAYGVAVSSSNVYVTTIDFNSMNVIGLTNNTEWKSYSWHAAGGFGIAVSSSNIYVGDNGGGTSIIGLSNNTDWKTISVGSFPYSVALTSYYTTQSSSFSSQVPNGTQSFTIYWSPTSTVEATYGGHNYTESPIVGVTGTYTISFNSSYYWELGSFSISVTYYESFATASYSVYHNETIVNTTTGTYSTILIIHKSHSHFVLLSAVIVTAYSRNTGHIEDFMSSQFNHTVLTFHVL